MCLTDFFLLLFKVDQTSRSSYLYNKEGRLERGIKSPGSRKSTCNSVGVEKEHELIKRDLIGKTKERSLRLHTDGVNPARIFQNCQVRTNYNEPSEVVFDWKNTRMKFTVTRCL